MTIAEIRAELSVRMIEFEQALDKGLSHPKLVEIYRDIKELQYNLTLAEAREFRPRYPGTTVIE